MVDESTPMLLAMAAHFSGLLLAWLGHLDQRLPATAGNVDAVYNLKASPSDGDLSYEEQGRFKFTDIN